MEKRTRKADGTFEYGSREEAERRFDEKIAERQLRFCPMWRGMCKESCTCYVRPKVVNQGSELKPSWDCKGGYCNCYMLVGPV